MRRWGKGPVEALFLHGFTGNSASFDHLAPLLGDLFSARCPDLPGHAGTALPAAGGRDGFEAVLETLGRTLEFTAVLVGYSQGARLALALATRHPGKIGRLILESPHPGLPRHQDRARRLAEDEARAAEIEAVGVEAFIRDWERLPLFEGIGADSSLAARRRSHQADGLAGALRCLGLGSQPDLWKALPRLEVPTLVITGARDEKFTAIARRMVAELRLGWRVSLAGVGHAPHLEAPQRYAAEVSAFVTAPFNAEESRPWTGRPTR